MPQIPAMHHHHVIPLLATIRYVAIVLMSGANVGMKLGAVVVATHQVATTLPVVVAITITQAANAVIAVGV